MRLWDMKAIISKKRVFVLFGTLMCVGIAISLSHSNPTVARPVPTHQETSKNKEVPLKPYLDPNKLFLRSGVGLVMEERDGTILYDKNIQNQRPIASLTKLMTAIVILDTNLPLDESITITKADRDRLRGTQSRLSYGTKLTRRDLLKIAIAASENRAAKALARTYPGGRESFITAMNKKAKALGMKDTKFRDASGLHSGNISTGADLAILVKTAADYSLIRKFSTTRIGSVKDLRSGWKIDFLNTNRLVRGSKWDISLSKTGYIADAGHCLVMVADIADRPIVIVLLNSWGYLSKFGDANRIKKWLDNASRNASKAEKSTGPPA